VLFAELHGRKITLLSRGSRDGFRVTIFHQRCDGHARPLTLIEDTSWNICRGFTRVKWESSKGEQKADPSLKSLLFLLKNLDNFAAIKFVLKDEKKGYTVTTRT
jgi:hypothetical protein